MELPVQKSPFWALMVIDVGARQQERGDVDGVKRVLGGARYLRNGGASQRGDEGAVDP